MRTLPLTNLFLHGFFLRNISSTCSLINTVFIFWSWSAFAPPTRSFTWFRSFAWLLRLSVFWWSWSFSFRFFFLFIFDIFRSWLLRSWLSTTFSIRFTISTSVPFDWTSFPIIGTLSRPFLIVFSLITLNLFLRWWMKWYFSSRTYRWLFIEFWLFRFFFYTKFIFLNIKGQSKLRLYTD